jgi:hypothetical protein
MTATVVSSVYKAQGRPDPGELLPLPESMKTMGGRSMILFRPQMKVNIASFA